MFWKKKEIISIGYSHSLKNALEQIENFVINTNKNDLEQIEKFFINTNKNESAKIKEILSKEIDVYDQRVINYNLESFLIMRIS